MGLASKEEILETKRGFEIEIELGLGECREERSLQCIWALLIHIRSFFVFCFVFFFFFSLQNHGNQSDFKSNSNSADKLILLILILLEIDRKADFL